MASNDKKTVVVKKSPIIIAKSFIVLQAAALVLYFIAAVSANYVRIYRTLPFSDVVSFQITQLVFIFAAEAVIIFYIFFHWNSEVYKITRDKVIFTKGIFTHHEESFPLNSGVTIKWRQGPLGKLGKYGHIKITDSKSQHWVNLNYIPNPRIISDLINKIIQKNNGAGAPAFPETLGVYDLLDKNEHQNLEFKASFRWDLRENKVNKFLEKSIMKTIAAFLNSDGGHLIIGIDDDRKIIGISSDYNSLGKKNTDGFENHFTHVFQNMIGAQFRQNVKLGYENVEGEECCVVSVAPSGRPVYLKADDKNEEFYIRTGNGTTSLKISEATEYINSKFPRN